MTISDVLPLARPSPPAPGVMLSLPGDQPPSAPLLADHLAGAPAGPAAIVLAIAAAVPALAARLAAGALPGDPARLVGRNEGGDGQKALDMGAHDHMIAALRGAPVRSVLSEEAAEPALLDPHAPFDVAIDPIDGSGSIGLGLPLGLLFSVMPAAPEGLLRAGRAVVAAGYVLFGHSTDMGLSTGAGTAIATFDATAGQFRVVRPRLTIPPTGGAVAFNASNVGVWPDGMQRWIGAAMAARGTNMRWLAAAVGELHRILLQGGVFLYPGDSRPGHEQGRLRLLYEAVPIAFLVEQAGELATDGRRPILDIVPASHHVHTPLVFGAAGEVEAITRSCL